MENEQAEKKQPIPCRDDFELQVAQRQRQIYGERFVGACISRLSLPEWAQSRLMEYMKKPKNFLLFCGSPGIGKTSVCAALTGWAMKNFGHSWRRWTENSLLKNLRESMESLKGDYLDALRYMIDDNLVILDDVGSGVKVNEWREEIFFNFVDYRYNTMKPTIITSNFSEMDFKEIYHSRVHSRLFAKENTIIQLHGGVDHRLNGCDD